MEAVIQAVQIHFRLHSRPASLLGKKSTRNRGGVGVIG